MTFWFPVAPGISTLPAAPAVVDGQMTVTTVVPVFNETVKLEAIARPRLEAYSADYALQLTTAAPALVYKTEFAVSRVMPVVNIQTQAISPSSISSGSSNAVDVTNIASQTFLPSIVIFTPMAASVLSPSADTSLSCNLPAVKATPAIPGVEFTISTQIPDSIGQFTPPIVPVIFSMDGSDGATSVTSIDATATTATFFGAAQLNTAIKKYGTASLATDGVNSYIQYNTAAMGGGEFTIEFWAYIPSTGNAYATIMAVGNNASIDYERSVNRIWWYDSYNINRAHLQAQPVLDSFNHIALYRLDGKIYLSINGTVWTRNTNYGFDFTDTLRTIGDYDGNLDYPFVGYIDDVRHHPSSALYGIENFTPPTGPLSP